MGRRNAGQVDVEIYQLRAFIAVARTGHMTRAAERLHLTQSAVSKQLKLLEEELGAPLFERSASGMALSVAGKRLLPLARCTLDAATELMSAAKLMQGWVSGLLRLGTLRRPPRQPGPQAMEVQSWPALRGGRFCCQGRGAGLARREPRPRAGLQHQSSVRSCQISGNSTTSSILRR
jgi:hypothetical protein